MKTKQKSFSLFFRSGKPRDKSQYKAYKLKEKDIEADYNTRRELLEAMSSYLIPFFYGMWDEIQIDIKAIKYDERNKD